MYTSGSADASSGVRLEIIDTDGTLVADGVLDAATRSLPLLPDDEDDTGLADIVAQARAHWASL